jgi:hydrophobic/amphiphilic exporter-1 (mainly G- bacteria), HAE1 family
MLVAIGLVYLLMVILFALLLAGIGAFVALAVTSRARDLSAIIGLLMLRGIVITNAIVLLDLVQHNIEAGDDVRTVLIQGSRTWKRAMLMTAAATILALIPQALSGGGGLIAASLATIVIGGLTSSTLLPLVVIPVIYSLLVGLQRGGAGSGRLEAPATGSGVLQS